MRLHDTPVRFAAIAVIAIGLGAPLGASEAAPRNGSRVLYAAEVERAGDASGFVDLSEDSGSGAGFYPLPKPYRAGAQRSRAAAAADGEEALGVALASEAVGDEFDEGYVFGNSHSVFNPVDGVGTPFFGGYYPH
jgi:hypothetical protein